MKQRIRCSLAALVAGALMTGSLAAAPGDWLAWRGPDQNGTSPETGLVDVITTDGAVWTYDLAGRGTPVVHGGRLYALGYEGEDAELQEMLVCIDVSTGEKLWDRRWSDFLSDSIYGRYAIGSPAVDPETGGIYTVSTPGVVSCWSPDGDLVWQRNSMSEFGRLSFPNGRTGSVTIDGERAIVHFISTSWGPQGPARDRFFAFDKKTGEVIWTATPGGPPKDGSFTFPVLVDVGKRRVLVAGTGCGRMACVDARTGDVVWVYPVSTGGVNSSALLYDGGIIGIHGKENLDSSTIGRMFSIPLSVTASGEPVVLEPSVERWRNDLVAFTSSPVLVGDRVYQTVATGDLCCVDAKSGKVLWREKLAPDQIHASPIAADGKLYVPMTNGTLHVVKPTDEGPEVLSTAQLAGNCLGAPAIANGRIFVHTTEKLYCFGEPEDSAEEAAWSFDVLAPADEAEPARLQVVPAEHVLRPGDTARLRARFLDANGVYLSDAPDVEWSVTPGLDAEITDGVLKARSQPGVGLVQAKAGDLTAAGRLRIAPALPYGEDFEGIELAPRPGSDDDLFGHPPGFWLGGRLKWEVVDREGEKVLAKTLSRALFQRSFTIVGHPEMSKYTVQVDILTDGNRRTKSSAGVLNQRYLIQLKGNHQEIEVSSNMMRLKETVPFMWKANAWYTLKTRVDLADDGSGVVRAKAWPRGEDEPDAWNIEVTDPYAHTSGTPGIFGFAPQSRFHVYVDNLSVTPNE